MVSQILRRQTGRSIRRYKLDKLLGHGSFGAVYRAQTYSTPVAVKIMEDEEAAKKESDILLELQQLPGVPQWRWFGKDENLHAIVMTLAHKDLNSVRSLMPDAKLTPPTIKKVLWQATTILESIHRKGIIHRDIKDNNLMTSIPGENGRVSLEIIDFGMARFHIDEDGNPVPEEPESHISDLPHTTPYVMMGDAHTPSDDLIQLTYAAWCLNGGCTNMFRKRRNELLIFKQKLIQDPAAVLPNEAQWMVGFFQAVARQFPGIDVNYDEVRQAISRMPGGGNGRGVLRFEEVRGTVHLI